MVLEAKIVLFKGINCGFCTLFNPYWEKFVKDCKMKNVSFEVIEFDMENPQTYDKTQPRGLQYYAGNYPNVFMWKFKDWSECKENQNKIAPVPFVINKENIGHNRQKDFENEVKKNLTLNHREYVFPKMSFQQPPPVMSGQTSLNQASPNSVPSNQVPPEIFDVCKKMITLVGARK